VKIGQTESQKNNLNPKWKKYFEIDWFFESKQELDIQIYDQDNDTATLNDDDFLGSVQTSLGAIVGGMGGRITVPVQYKGKPKGTMTLTVEQLSGGKVRHFRCCCRAPSRRLPGFGLGH
jgi:Ca2+-dependent lipid-binding protein